MSDVRPEYRTPLLRKFEIQQHMRQIEANRQRMQQEAEQHIRELQADGQRERQRLQADAQKAYAARTNLDERTSLNPDLASHPRPYNGPIHELYGHTIPSAVAAITPDIYSQQFAPITPPPPLPRNNRTIDQLLTEQQDTQVRPAWWGDLQQFMQQSR